MIWKAISSWNFVCQRGFCTSKLHYNHCGMSKKVRRQPYAWLWTQKSLVWLKKNFSCFWLNPWIDMLGTIFCNVTSNGSWFFRHNSKSTVSTFFTLLTPHVMQKYILDGYWALQTVFGHSKTWFWREKNTVPNVICNIVCTKTLNFYRIIPQVNWWVFERHHSPQKSFDPLSGDRTDRCWRANKLFVSRSRLKKC